MITIEAQKSDRFVNSLYSASNCNGYIERFTEELETLKARLDQITSVKFYTAEIKREKAKLEKNIAYKTDIIAEIQFMQKFQPGSWVKTGSLTPGQVIELRVVGTVPEVQVQWWGSTVPVPERPRKLTLVDEEQLEYIWNGDRFPKLVRRLDRIECDEIEVLTRSLGELSEARTSGKANNEPIEIIEDIRLQVTYLKKRIAWVNRNDLDNLERTIKQGLEIFYRVGSALAEIRDRKLYKELGYSNFRDYLDKKWNMKKSRAYQLINGAEVVDNLSAAKSVHHGGQNEPIAYQSSDKPSEVLIPKSERVAREIGKAPVDKQSFVWEQSIDRFGDNPTAKEVKSVVAEILNQDSNCQGSPSTVQISSTGSLKVGREKLAEQFKVGQLVKLELSSMDGVSEELRMSNHSYGQITALTENKCSFNVSVLGHTSFVVSPEDLKPVDSVSFCVNFTPEQFLALMFRHKSRYGIEAAIVEGVLGK